MLIGMTGASGLLGSQLVRSLVAEGHSIKALIRNASQRALLPAETSVVVGDLSNPTALGDFVANCDVVIHLAAQVAHAEQTTYWQVNVEGTEHLCEAIVRHNPYCRLVHCSTLNVKRRIPFKTAYTRSKAAGDDVVRRYIAAHNLRATLVFPGLVLSPHDQVLLPTMIKYLQKRRMVLISGGEEYLPAIHIEDLCRLFVGIVASRPERLEYLGFAGYHEGVHTLIHSLCTALNLPEPTLRLPRLPLLFLAWLKIYLPRTLQKRLKFSLREIDVMSLRYQSHEPLEYPDINWRPRISFHQAVEMSLKQWKQTNAS